MKKQLEVIRKLSIKKIYNEKFCNPCKTLKHHTFFRKIKLNTNKGKKLHGFRGSEKTLHYSICKSCENQRMKERYTSNPIPQMLSNAKIRAKKKGVPFSIKSEDIRSIWPADNKCPILKVKFEMGYSKVVGIRKDRFYAPSLDRVDPKLGYVPGNLLIICDIVNRMKQDASIEIMEKVYKFYKKWIEDNKKS
jgi:hypothetical protein